MFTIRRSDTFGEVFFGVQKQDPWHIFPPTPPWQLKQQPKSPRRKKDKPEPVEDRSLIRVGEKEESVDFLVGSFCSFLDYCMEWHIICETL